MKRTEMIIGVWTFVLFFGCNLFAQEKQNGFYIQPYDDIIGKFNGEQKININFEELTIINSEDYKTGYLNYADLQKLNSLDNPPSTSYDSDLKPIRPQSLHESGKQWDKWQNYLLSHPNEFNTPREEDMSIVDMSKLPLLNSKYDRNWKPYMDIEENRAQQKKEEINMVLLITIPLLLAFFIVMAILKANDKDHKKVSEE